MGRKKKGKSERVTHVQGKGWSDVYRDGKAYVYTAWNDNEPEVGVAMSYDEWARAYRKKKGR